jgi:hypothetical protein
LAEEIFLDAAEHVLAGGHSEPGRDRRFESRSLQRRVTNEPRSATGEAIALWRPAGKRSKLPPKVTRWR